jgi:hypothetical protein
MASMRLHTAKHTTCRLRALCCSVWQTPESVAGPAVQAALLAGYRHVDTAAIYEARRRRRYSSLRHRLRGDLRHDEAMERGAVVVPCRG